MGGLKSVIWATGAALSFDTTPGGGEWQVLVTSLIRGYRIPVRTGSFASTAQVSDDGAAYFRDELSFVPMAGSEEASALLAALASKSDDALVIIAEDANGGSWLMGRGLAGVSGNLAETLVDYPLWLSGGGVQSGAAAGDLNGGQVTIASVHPLPALRVSLDGDTVLNPNDF